MMRFLVLFCISAMSVCGADMETLVSNSCLDCHDDLTEKGGLSLESTDSVIGLENAEIWEKCLEQVERGFMPPPDKDQPTDEVKNGALLDLEDRLVAYHSKRPGHHRHTVLRRLNRTEYRNTIEDLFRMETGLDPTREFPGEQLSHGFASNGETLVTSGFLLRQYLEAAETIIEQAVQFGEKPEQKVWQMKSPFDRTSGQEISQALRYYEKNGEPQPYQDICQRIGAGGAPFRNYHPLDDVSDDGVPCSGRYRIKILVEGKYRYSFENEFFKRWSSLWDDSEPIRLSLFTATLQGLDPENKEARTFTATHEQASQKHVATWDLPDDEKVWLECEFHLEKGQFPRLGFPNGPTNANYRMNTYFKDLAKSKMTPEEFTEFEASLKKYGGWFSFHLGESPRIRLYEIELQGPINDTWPPESHQVIFGNEAYDSSQAGAALERFAGKAWRRPVEEKEIDPLLKLVTAAEKSGMNPEEAIIEGLKAILCSPAFIYREEKSDRLNDYELASRLSYFLTSSMPDDELLALAKLSKLSGDLRGQAERLLAGADSDQFVNEFLDGWLHLNKLGSMAPDPHRFRPYYDDRLEPAMRRETRVFFHHLLKSNRKIAEFIDSDYTFANKELALLYGIKPEEFDKIRVSEVENLPARYLQQDGLGSSPTTGFAKIPVTDPRRGGLLGQAALLTLTANGVDTSPVIRGVWLLENILGTPPSPPPPDVPAIEPDIRGAKTIRDQLQKHRSAKACRSCHAHIDPPGFALESFDPIGRWRGHYRVGDKYIEIDPSGDFSGIEFNNVADFKKLLLAREDAFARCLVEKLMMHALGRDLEITDRPAIRGILSETAKDGYRLRDIVLAVVESEIFRQK
ncbi:MAG: DUF1592 domain-containing protein [Verrucomicrobiales bacterium]|nr:DUF1592 domain-containing protein [Verrucomicrobiales bacterium]